MWIKERVTSHIKMIYMLVSIRDAEQWKIANSG
jgi:hypothetical protein